MESKEPKKTEFDLDTFIEKLVNVIKTKDIKRWLKSK